MSEPTLQDKLRANKAKTIAQADATAKKEKDQKIQEQIKLQKQQEQQSAAYKKHQEDLARYQQEKAEYDEAVRKLEEEKRIEEEKAAAIKAEQQRIEQQKQAIQKKHDDRLAALGPVPSAKVKVPYYYTNRYTGKRTLKGYRTTETKSSRAAVRRWYSDRDRIKREASAELQRFNLANSPLPQWAKTKASREWTHHHGTSMIGLAQRYYDSKKAQEERRRQSSITTAKSNAVKAREQHEKTIREYEAKRDSGLAAPPILPTKPKMQLTKATKRKPTVIKEPFYISKGKPVSIIGSTTTLSRKAEATFANTQKDQKKLFHEITGASSWNDAISLRKHSMESNPYVGTANTWYYKGEAIGTSGVLIEKKINKEIEYDSVIPTEPKPEKITKQATEVIPQTVPSQNIPRPEMETSYYLPGSLSYLYGTKQKSYSIPEILKGNSENSDPLQDIADAAKNPIHNLKETFVAIPEAVSRDFKYGFQLDEFGRTPGTAYFEDAVSPKLKPTLLDSLISGKPTGRSTTFNVASGIVEGAMFLAPIPGLKGIGKVKTATANIKNKNKAQKLGEKIFETPKDLQLEQKLDDDVIFRRKPSKLAKAIKSFNRDTPVGVEKISEDSFLITAGVETKNPLPAVLYNPKSGKSTVFSPVPEDAKTAPRGILVKGKSAKEFSDSKPVGKDISYAPGTRDNLEKISNRSIEKYLKPESLITDVHTSFLEKYPKVATFGADKVNSNLFVTTEMRNLARGFESDVARLDPPDYIGTKKGDSKSFEKSVKDIIGAEKSRGSLQRADVDRYFKNSSPSKPKSSKSGNTKSNTTTKSKSRHHDISIVDETILHPSRPKIKPTSTPMLDNLLGQKQQHSIKLDVAPQTNSKLGNFLESQITPKLDDMTKTKPKSKQRQHLYDLLVHRAKQGVRGKPVFDFAFSFSQKSKNRFDFGYKPPSGRTTTRRPPSIGIPDFGLKPKRQSKRRTSKRASKYSIWNVDVENIGALPGAELEVSKSRKIYSKLDKRQKEYSKGKTRKKSTKKTTKRRARK